MSGERRRGVSSAEDVLVGARAVGRAALLGLVLAAAPTPARAAAPDPPRPLLWATDAEGGAPYIFKDPQNPSRDIGFEVDLAQALARTLGRPIQMVQYDFTTLLTGLERGDFDFAMDGIEITPDRKRKVHFSRPYYVYREQLVVRAGEAARLPSLDACRQGRTLVGTMEETAAERMLDQMQISKKIYDDPVAAYRDLVLERIDAVLLDLPIAEYYARPNPQLAYAGPPVGKGYYAIAFRKSDAQTATAFDAAIERLLKAGELRRIYERWHLWNEDQEELGIASQDIVGEAARAWTFRRYFPLLAESALVTVEITLCGMLLAIVIGLPIALSRLYGPSPIRWLAVGYVEFFRGIPVLLLLYFLYYGLPAISAYYHIGVSLKLTPLVAAVLGFGLNYGAYEAEIYRAGIGAVPQGQWEAAASLGMSRRLTFRRIILPQAVRIILPPMTSDLVALFKDTSIVSVIAVVELSKQYQILSRSSMKYLEIGVATATLYLILSVPLGALSRALERRWGRGHG
ncbi:MAG TPA: ABC transporter substrate-binding protein/permease [Polyangia bacterium]|nr:ABC transporter substrate-binding protein/permease [Polyangia bacterium]